MQKSPITLTYRGSRFGKFPASSVCSSIPDSDVFMSSKSIEKILLRETNEDMPYRTWFDDYATTFDLKPGEMLTRRRSTHRIRSKITDCAFDISVTMEHWTKSIWNSYAVHYGNGVLRRTLGLQNTIDPRSWTTRLSKSGIGLLVEKDGPARSREMSSRLAIFASHPTVANGLEEHRLSRCSISLEERLRCWRLTENHSRST